MTAQRAHNAIATARAIQTAERYSAGIPLEIPYAARQDAEMAMADQKHRPTAETLSCPILSPAHSNSGRRLWSRSIATFLGFSGQRIGMPLLLAVPTTSTSSMTLPMRRHSRGSRTLT
jgi:hypothetical protein